MAKKMELEFVLQERTYLNRRGEVCARDDKSRASLLGGKGARISMERAIKLGLANADGTPVQQGEAEEMAGLPGAGEQLNADGETEAVKLNQDEESEQPKSTVETKVITDPETKLMPSPNKSKKK